MWKKTIAVATLASVLAFGAVGCGSSSNSSSTSASSGESSTASAASNATSSSTSASSSSSTASAASSDTYESILEEYSAKIQAAVPGLVDEYNSESASLTGMQEKAELSNEKISKLADINVEGAEKMAELMYKNNDAYSTYEDWANKLNGVYMDASQQITDAYMANATS